VAIPDPEALQRRRNRDGVGALRFTSCICASLGL
jgi:hypothetical protein